MPESKSKAEQRSDKILEIYREILITTQYLDWTLVYNKIKFHKHRNWLHNYVYSAYTTQRFFFFFNLATHEFIFLEF